MKKHEYQIINGKGEILKIKGNKIYCNSEWGYTLFENGTQTNYNFKYNNKDNCLMSCATRAIEIDDENNLNIGFIQECDTGGLLNFTNCEKLIENKNIYALKKIENNLWIGTDNGIIKMSKNNLGLNKNNFSKQKIVYPNPSQDKIFITNTNNKLNQFSIINIKGKLIKKGIIKNSEIDISKLKKGIYLLTITIGNDTYTKKIIKN